MALIDEYRKMARRADDRLRALESLQGQENFKNVTDWAYKRAMHDIRSWGGSNRFGKGAGAVKGMSDRQIRAKMADIEKFLDSATSTKTGIKSIYQQRANTLNDELGLEGKDKINWQEWANFWRSDAYKDLKGYFDGSDTMVSMVGQFRRQKDEILKAIKDNDFRHVSISPEMARASAVEYLKKNGMDLLDLFG